MIKHQEKAHADEVRQHKERARAGEFAAWWSQDAVIGLKFELRQVKATCTMCADPENVNSDLTAETSDLKNTD